MVTFPNPSPRTRHCVIDDGDWKAWLRDVMTSLMTFKIKVWPVVFFFFYVSKQIVGSKRITPLTYYSIIYSTYHIFVHFYTVQWIQHTIYIQTTCLYRTLSGLTHGCTTLAGISFKNNAAASPAENIGSQIRKKALCVTFSLLNSDRLFYFI